MKSLLAIPLTIALVALPATAQRGGHGGGKPASTGLQHAQMTANEHGQRGIENAENKQARPHGSEGKKLAKGHLKTKKDKKHKKS